jgi:hypothetical protein
MHQTLRWLAASLSSVFLWWDLIHLKSLIDQYSIQRSTLHSLQYGRNMFPRSAGSSSPSSVTGILIGTVVGLGALGTLIFCYWRYRCYRRNRVFVRRTKEIIQCDLRKRRRRGKRCLSGRGYAAQGPLPPPSSPLPEASPPPLPLLQASATPPTIFLPRELWNPTELERDMASRNIQLDRPESKFSASTLPGAQDDLGIQPRDSPLNITPQGKQVSAF